MRSTRFWSPSETSASISKRRFRLFVFFVKMWRACECPRLILPVAVKRKRFAAPLCVFSFGMIAPFQIFQISNLIFVARGRRRKPPPQLLILLKRTSVVFLVHFRRRRGFEATQADPVWRRLYVSLGQRK